MRSFELRQAIAALLLIVLTCTGVGRALACEAQPVRLRLAGVSVEICHAGHPGTPVPDRPVRHECCVACLCSSGAMPVAAPDVVPACVEHVAAHAVAAHRAPSVTRIATPRLSQGPPAA